MPKLKNPTRGKLKKILWRVFSVFIRARDKYVCFTCDTYEYPGNAGHFIPAGACGNEMYFSEENVHHQCVHCNFTLEGSRTIYRERMIKKYGLRRVIEIEQTYHRVNPAYPFEQKIEYYREKIKNYEVQAAYD